MGESNIIRENMPMPGGEGTRSRGEMPKTPIESVENALGESGPGGLRQKWGKSKSKPAGVVERSPAEIKREAKEARILDDDRQKEMEKVKKGDAEYIARLEAQKAKLDTNSKEYVAVARALNQAKAPLY